MIGMNQPTDEELVQAMRNGNREGFLLLYDRHAPLIRAICTATTQNIEEGQELAQEVFFRAFSKINRLQKSERFAGWLVGLARNVGKEWRKRRFRDRRRYGGEITEEVVAASHPLGDEEENLRLHKALGRLPEKERLAVHLFYLEEEPVERACSLMGVSRSGFYRLLERGRRRLAAWLSDSEKALLQYAKEPIDGLGT
jgi:RNA polymerase sigma factor (sigma-70 family)